MRQAPSGMSVRLSPWMARGRAGTGLVLWLGILVVAAGLGIAGTAVVNAQDTPAVGIEVRVWQHVEDDRDLYISARQEGGSWGTLGTIPLPLDDGSSPSGRHRYGNIALGVYLPGPATVAVRVWQDTQDGSNIFIAARETTGSRSWTEAMRLPLGDGFNSTGAFRYGNGALLVPVPRDPTLEACSNGVVVPEPEENPGLVWDCAVLLNARDILVGDGKPLDWSADRPLRRWWWVSAGGTPRRVTSLKLWGRGLAGQIPSSLGLLEHLVELDLTDNQLTGGIPRELGQLSNLRKLSLSGNGLTGEIPPDLGRLSNLAKLWLARNGLTGRMPAALGQLPDLWELSLRGTQLSCIPLALKMRFATSTHEFRVCEATSVAPPSAGSLEACSNGVATPEPASNPGLVADCAILLDLRPVLAGRSQAIDWTADQSVAEWQWVTVGGSPPRVTALALPGTRDTELPARLVHLSHLQTLDASGMGGEIPPQLGHLADLRELNLRSNSFTGEIPPELGRLAQLEVLDLGGSLTGSLPPELGQLANLRELRLRRIWIAGEIPPELGQLGNLVVLDLLGNHLEGAIPPQLGQLRNLESLYLDDNDLRGGIPPELAQLTRLERLGLSGNELTGPIPPELAQLPSLQYLGLSDNALTGPVPSELAKLGQLQGLSLSGNELTGAIPPALAQLAYLRGLNLSDNALTGAIPPEFGSLPRIHNLNLSENRLTGPIPPELASARSLQQLDLHRNRLTGGIPREFGRLELTLLDLQDNQLSGEIPAELADAFDAPIGLLLSGNQWEGCLHPALQPLIWSGTISDTDDMDPVSDLDLLGLSFCDEEQ